MAGNMIPAIEFERKIAELCLGGVGPGLPRKSRNRHILLKAAAMAIGQGSQRTEKEINELLASWLDALGPTVRLDHVSLRRHLIDEGYVERDPAGAVYNIHNPDSQPVQFEPAVEAFDTIQVLRRASEERERKRLRH